jgi:tetratricopeptide (TPR) repeat protein
LSSSYQKDDFESAIQILQEGIEIYGDDISLYTVLGITYFKYFHSGNSTDIGLIGKTEEYLEMVREIDAESAQAILLQGMLAYYKGDLLEAGINLRKANDLLVSDPSSMFYLCLLYRNIGEIKQARSLATRLSEIDPLTASSQILPAIIYYFDGKFQKAYESAKTAFQDFKQHPIVLFYIGIFANTLHKRKDAIGYFEMNYQINETNMFAGLGLIYKNAILGQKDLVLRGLEKYLPAVETSIEELSLWIADIYSMISEKDQAIEYLKKAAKKGFVNISYLKNIDPNLAEVRKEALFASVVKEVHEKSESI